MKTLRIFMVMALGLVLTMGLVACSSKPSENLAKTTVVKSIQNGWPGMTKVISFQKMNGEGDNNYYSISYSARFEIIKDMKAYSPKGMGFHIVALKGFKWINHSGAKQQQNVKKGDVFETSGSQRFKKTEKGWIPSR